MSDESPKPGRYKLAIQRAATAHFAEIEVQICPGREDVVLFQCPPEQIRGWRQHWRAPVTAGVERALRELKRRGELHHPIQVDVLFFRGLYVDTFEQQASMAVFAATARALLGSESWPKVVCVEGSPRVLRIDWGPLS